jgi:hypothetical protein
VDGEREHAAAALDQQQASLYLGLEEGSRWLDNAPIPWVDMRKPGATKPLKRWLVSDLDAFLHERRILPGHPSPYDSRQAVPESSQTCHAQNAAD